MSCAERGPHDTKGAASIAITIRQPSSNKQVGRIFAGECPQRNVIGAILVDHPPDGRLPWFCMILHRPRSQANHIVEVCSVLDILCRYLIECIHVTGLTCSNFWSSSKDIRVLTTRQSANGLQIGPGLFSPIDFRFGQTLCISGVVILITEVGCHVVCDGTPEEKPVSGAIGFSPRLFTF